jgi:hypothetical protein
MEPETVIAGFIANDDLNLVRSAAPLARLQAAKECQQTSNIAARQPVTGGPAAWRTLRGQ